MDVWRYSVLCTLHHFISNSKIIFNRWSQQDRTSSAIQEMVIILYWCCTSFLRRWSRKWWERVRSISSLAWPDPFRCCDCTAWKWRLEKKNHDLAPELAAYALTRSFSQFVYQCLYWHTGNGWNQWMKLIEIQVVVQLWNSAVQMMQLYGGYELHLKVLHHHDCYPFSALL